MKYLLLLFFTVYSAFASILLDDSSPIKEKFKINYYQDTTNQLGIEEVSKKQFQSISNRYTLGHDFQTLWFHFDLTNKSDTLKWVLLCYEPYFLEATLYQKRNGSWYEEKNGLQILTKDKNNPHSKPIFILDFTHNSQQEIYIKLKGKIASANEFKLIKEEYYQGIYSHLEDILYAVLFGILIMIIALNLFIYVRMKELLYLYYALYILFYGLWIFAYSGLLLYTFLDGYFYEFLLVIPLFAMFLLLFSLEFLNVKEHLPKLSKWLYIMAYSYVVLVVLIRFQFNPWYEYMVYMVIVSFTLMIGVACYLWFKLQQTNVKLYVIIMSIYLGSLFIVACMVNGWIENNDFTRFGFLFASIFEMLFFTLILINRFYLFYQEKVTMQEEMLDLKHENQIRLEEEISLRTKDVVILLEDKELLLKELYHRVKNNFQNIIGVLWLEANKEENHSSKELLQKLIARIKSMSLIHQFLYEQKRFTSIDAMTYIDKLILEMKKIYLDEKINISSEVQSFNLNMEDANNLAMIINEIVTNSIKYCHGECAIKLKLKTNEQQVYLMIEDNGKGFELNQVEKGLGLNLIKQFTQKLTKATYKFSFQNGTKFELFFTSNIHKKTP